MLKKLNKGTVYQLFLANLDFIPTHTVIEEVGLSYRSMSGELYKVTDKPFCVKNIRMNRLTWELEFNFLWVENEQIQDKWIALSEINSHEFLSTFLVSMDDECVNSFFHYLSYSCLPLLKEMANSDIRIGTGYRNRRLHWLCRFTEGSSRIGGELLQFVNDLAMSVDGPVVDGNSTLDELYQAIEYCLSRIRWDEMWEETEILELLGRLKISDNEEEKNRLFGSVCFLLGDRFKIDCAIATGVFEKALLAVSSSLDRDMSVGSATSGGSGLWKRLTSNLAYALTLDGEELLLIRALDFFRRHSAYQGESFRDCRFYETLGLPYDCSSCAGFCGFDCLDMDESDDVAPGDQWLM